MSNYWDQEQYLRRGHGASQFAEKKRKEIEEEKEEE